MFRSLGISLNHDDGFTIVENNKVELVFQLSQFYNIKHFSIDLFNRPNMYYRAERYITNLYNFFTTVSVSCQLNNINYNIIRSRAKNFKTKQFTNMDHRDSHALSVCKLDNLNNCLVVVIDSGGNGRVTFYSYDNNSLVRLSNSYDKLYGIVYNYLSQILINGIFGRSDNDQDTPGKFMGFASFGSYNDALAEKIIDLFNWDYCNVDILNGYHKIISELKDEISLKDFCFTFQQIWIDYIIKEIEYFQQDYKNVCVAGGCFLNCNLNRRLYQTDWFDRITFTPVPNDVGLNLGASIGNNVINNFTPFVGPKAFDLYDLPKYKERFKFIKYNYGYIADLIHKGKIIGTIYGRSEIGPRALGHRSILASATLDTIKDKLNLKIKHRESYRPYGGIIIREDINKYFDMDIDSRYMNVVVMNKTNKFPAITHIDNSTRIQTVTKEQDSFMYNLLKSYESVSGYPIMLNTSFNVAGKPIINRLSDAFDMLGNRKIDGLIVDDLFFSNS